LVDIRLSYCKNKKGAVFLRHRILTVEHKFKYR